MKFLFVILFTTLQLFFLSNLFGQTVATIELANIKIDVQAHDFYIKNIFDDRQETEQIAKIVEGGKSKPVLINLKDGLCVGFKKYIDKCLKQQDDGAMPNSLNDVSATPISLHIVKLEGKAKKNKDKYEVEIKMGLAFYFEGNKVFETNKSSQGTVSDPKSFFEKFLREALMDRIKKFDEGWAEIKDKVATNPDVKINLAIGKSQFRRDTIVYDSRIPLKISDFQGEPRKDRGQAGAETASGIIFNYKTRTEKGQWVTDVTITVIFDKTTSWFIETAKNPYTLAHEQLHFDVTAIVACELAKRIKETKFTRDNLVTLLNEFKDESIKKREEMQAQYDGETNHGLIREKQEEWSRKIKQRLNEQDCF